MATAGSRKAPAMAVIAVVLVDVLMEQIEGLEPSASRLEVWRSSSDGPDLRGGGDGNRTRNPSGHPAYETREAKTSSLLPATTQRTSRSLAARPNLGGPEVKDKGPIRRVQALSGTPLLVLQPGVGRRAGTSISVATSPIRRPARRPESLGPSAPWRPSSPAAGHRCASRPRPTPGPPSSAPGSAPARLSDRGRSA